jgi:hypothetical protein
MTTQKYTLRRIADDDYHWCIGKNQTGSAIVPSDLGLEQVNDLLRTCTMRYVAILNSKGKIIFYDQRTLKSLPFKNEKTATMTTNTHSTWKIIIKPGEPVYFLNLQTKETRYNAPDHLLEDDAKQYLLTKIPENYFVFVRDHRFYLQKRTIYRDNSPSIVFRDESLNFPVTIFEAISGPVHTE